MNRIRFRAKKTFKSVLFIILSIVFITASILFLFNYGSSKKNAEQQIMSSEKNNLSHFKETLEDSFDKIVLINAAFSGQYIPSVDIAEKESYSTYTSVIKQLTLCITMYDYIDGIFLENDNYNAKRGPATVESIENADRFGNYKNTEVYLSQQSGLPQLVFYQPESGDSDNRVIVSINGRNLGKSLLGSYKKDNIKLVTDKDGRIIISNRNDHIGKNLSDCFGLEYNPLKDYRKVSLGEGDYAFCSSEIGELGLYCVSLTPLSVYESYSKSVHYKSILFGIILLCVTAVLTVLIAYVAYRPLRSVLKTAYDYYPMEIDSHYDEIKAIQDILKKTHQDNANLKFSIEQNIETIRHQQVLALQSQISPHFIYNVLDSINWMSVYLNGCDNVVSDCIQSTQTLFSYCMNYTSIFATLREEIDIAQNMVIILSSQFNLEIEITEDIPDELYERKILKMCLEPLFENSIIHGYANYRSEGTIHIEARENEKDITLKISDRGIGMTPKELNNLREAVNTVPDDTGSHIGLRNVNMRLKLLFGEDYTLKIDSRKNKGTAFTLSIPKLEI